MSQTNHQIEVVDNYRIDPSTETPGPGPEKRAQFNPDNILWPYTKYLFPKLNAITYVVFWSTDKRRHYTMLAAILSAVPLIALMPLLLKVIPLWLVLLVFAIGQYVRPSYHDEEQVRLLTKQPNIYLAFKEAPAEFIGSLFCLGMLTLFASFLAGLMSYFILEAILDVLTDFYLTTDIR